MTLKKYKNNLARKNKIIQVFHQLCCKNSFNFFRESYYGYMITVTSLVDSGHQHSSRALFLLKVNQVRRQSFKCHGKTSRFSHEEAASMPRTTVISVWVAIVEANPIFSKSPSQMNLKSFSHLINIVCPCQQSKTR